MGGRIFMIKIKRGEFDVLSSKILEDGQPAYSTDTHVFKIGNGENTFAQLPSLSPDPTIYTSTWLNPPSSYNLGSSSAHINSSYIDDMYTDSIHGLTSSADITVHNDILPNSTTLALGSTSDYWYNAYISRLHVQSISPKGSSYSMTLAASGTNVRISNVATPTSDNDVANKSYVDGLINPNAGNLTNKTTTTSDQGVTYTWVYPDKAVSSSSTGVGYFSIGFSNRAIVASSGTVTDTISIPAECLPTGICLWMAFIYNASATSGGSAVDTITSVTPNFGKMLGTGTADRDIEVEFDISSISNARGGQIGVLVMGTGDMGLGI